MPETARGPAQLVTRVANISVEAIQLLRIGELRCVVCAPFRFGNRSVLCGVLMRVSLGRRWGAGRERSDGATPCHHDRCDNVPDTRCDEHRDE